MALPSIRRLALADLDPETLREFVEHGEDLLVERKQALPSAPGFGAAVGSFANTIGGWVLLGVADDATLVGFEKPKKLDLQSHLAAVLRKQVDPLPPFVAAMRPYGEREIAVVRVFESADSPHIVRGPGAVYVRTSKGKEPVDDHRTLLELARRGEKADKDARERLPRPPLIQHAFAAKDVNPTLVPNRLGDPEYVRVIVRAAPVTVTPQFADWPISRAGPNACYRFADSLGVTGNPSSKGGLHVQPFARGVIARKVALEPMPGNWRWGAIVAADSAGVVGAALSHRKHRSVDLSALRHEMIRPALNAVAGMLGEAEAYGRSQLDVWACFPGDIGIDGGQGVPLLRAENVREIRVAREFTIPADDDELGALGREVERELGRNFGMKLWEGDEPDE